MAQIQDIDIAVDFIKNLFTGDEIRGCSLVLSMYRPRSPSISLSGSNEEYHIHVKRDSDRMDEDEPVSFVGNSQVEYKTQEKKKDQVSKVADNTDNMFHQHGPNKVPVSSSLSGSNVFNIQLNYNIN